MLFNIISHWPDILKTAAAVVVFVCGTATALNVLCVLIGGLFNLLGFKAAASFMAKVAGAVSYFGAEVHLLAVKYGILPADQKPAPVAGGGTPSASVRVDTYRGHEVEPPVARPRTDGRFFTAVVIVFFALVLPAVAGSIAAGCGAFGSKTPQVEHAAVDVGVCVLEHALAGESVKQIAADCDGIAEKDVIDILAAHEKLAAHEAASSHPAPSASACPTGK